MARKIGVSSGPAVRVVAVVLAGALIATAYFLITIQRPWPFYGCAPELPDAYALFLATVRAVMGLGFVLVALRRPARVGDRFFGVMILVLFATFAIPSGAYTIATGVARFGQSACLTVEGPLSYALGTFAIVVGGLALLSAALVGIADEDADD